MNETIRRAVVMDILEMHLAALQCDMARATEPNEQILDGVMRRVIAEKRIETVESIIRCVKEMA